MRRSGRRPASAFVVGVLSSFVFPAFSFSSLASTRDIRIVGAKMVAPEEYKMTMVWKLEMNKMLRDISRGFKDRFGLAFRVMETEFWQPETRPKARPRKAPSRERQLLRLLIAKPELGRGVTWDADVVEGSEARAVAAVLAYIAGHPHLDKGAMLLEAFRGAPESQLLEEAAAEVLATDIGSELREMLWRTYRERD